MAFLVRPIRPDQLAPTITLAVARFRALWKTTMRSVDGRVNVELANPLLRPGELAQCVQSAAGTLTRITLIARA